MKNVVKIMVLMMGVGLLSSVIQTSQAELEDALIAELAEEAILEAEQEAAELAE